MISKNINQGSPKTDERIKARLLFGGLIVVVPVYNEEEIIDVFLERLTGTAKETSLYGIVIVDDGSTDQSVSIVKNFSEHSPVHIRLVRLSRNFGHQNAIIAGLSTACEWAKQDDISWVGVIDADLQDRPEHFKDLLMESKHQDVVYAFRAARNDGFVMKAFAPIFYSLLAQSARFSIPKNAGTFSIIRTEVAWIICQASDVNPYFPGLRAWVGFRQRGVPLQRDARLAGESRVGLIGLFSLSFRALFSYSNLPLTFIVSLGLLIIVISIVISVFLVVLKLLGLVPIPGVTSTILLILFSLGVQTLFLGMISYMVNRATAVSSRQQSFIVMDAKDLK